MYQSLGRLLKCFYVNKMGYGEILKENGIILSGQKPYIDTNDRRRE